LTRSLTEKNPQTLGFSLEFYTTSSLTRFIIRAKKATYVSGGVKNSSSRPGSHDLSFREGDWTYRDSYFGGTDFIGQETVWLKDEPVWSMIYYGYIFRPDLIDGGRAAQTLRAALSTETAQGRLLDNFECSGPHGHFSISSEGSIEHFKGRETITVNGTLAYALDYMGGLIKP
jgi:Domain of unknown function (DUF5680)